MDAGTGFSSQVYELSPYFLDKVSSKLGPFFLYLSILICYGLWACVTAHGQGERADGMSNRS
jgi:hypothetical protein